MSDAVEDAAAEADLLKNWECMLCLKLLYEPVTYPCGHSFCKRCDRCLQADEYKCPTCRASLKTAPSTSIALHQLLAHTFPSDYALRKQEDEAEPAMPPPAGNNKLPLFMLDAMLPGQHMYLNVFEMRYRMLVQRCLSEGIPFGMVGYFDGNPYSTPSEYGTEVEIVSTQSLPDGRFHLEIKGKRCFRVINKTLRDGYNEAIVDYSDVPDLGDGVTREEALALVGRVHTLLEQWESLVHLNGWERSRNQLQRIKQVLGSMPSDSSEQSAGKLALWAAALINPLPPLGVAPELRATVMSAQTGYERLVVVEHGLQDSIQYVSQVRGSVSISVLGITVKVQYIGAFLLAAYLAYRWSDQVQACLAYLPGLARLLSYSTNNTNAQAGEL